MDESQVNPCVMAQDLLSAAVPVPFLCAAGGRDNAHRLLISMLNRRLLSAGILLSKTGVFTYEKPGGCYELQEKPGQTPSERRSLRTTTTPAAQRKGTLESRSKQHTLTLTLILPFSSLSISSLLFRSPFLSLSPSSVR